MININGLYDLEDTYCYRRSEVLNIEELIDIEDIQSRVPYTYYIGKYRDLAEVNLALNRVIPLSPKSYSNRPVFESDKFITLYKWLKNTYNDCRVIVDARMGTLVYIISTKYTFPNLFTKDVTFAKPDEDGAMDDTLVLDRNNILGRISYTNSLPLILWIEGYVDFINQPELKVDNIGKMIILNTIKKSCSNNYSYPYLENKVEFEGRVEPNTKLHSKVIHNMCFHAMEYALRDEADITVVPELDPDEDDNTWSGDLDAEYYNPKYHTVHLDDIIKGIDLSSLNKNIRYTVIRGSVSLPGLIYKRMEYLPSTKYIVVYSDTILTLEQVRKIMEYDKIIMSPSLEDRNTSTSVEDESFD